MTLTLTHPQPVPGEPDLTLPEVQALLGTKPHPRVTEELIKYKIDDVGYLVRGVTTLCFITMANGFVFVGHSTPASPANFDREIGQRYAYDNAFRQIWTHEGYLLRERLAVGRFAGGDQRGVTGASQSEPHVEM